MKHLPSLDVDLLQPNGQPEPILQEVVIWGDPSVEQASVCALQTAADHHFKIIPL